MAFIADNLMATSSGPLVPGSNPLRYSRNHVYSTADAVATVAAANYFNAAAAQFGLGDIIDVVFATGGTVGGRSFVVQSVTAGVVTIAAFS